MMTEVALPGNILLSVKSNGSVGTGLDTGLTAIAQLTVQQHDSVCSPGDRLFRAGVCTGRFLAMLAEVDPV
jgi:hypothetical protein